MARDPRLVNVPTMTRLGTVLVPVQASNGKGFVFELSRSQWCDMRDRIAGEFARIDRQAELGRAMLDIDRHESVV